MQSQYTDFADLTPKQAKCLPLLSAGLPASEVSKVVKVSQVQISSWKNDANFMAALDTVRRNATREAELALASLAMDAVQVLRESTSSASSQQVRLRAAMFIIEKLGLSANAEVNEAGKVNMGMLLTALGE